MEQSCLQPGQKHAAMQTGEGMKQTLAVRSLGKPEIWDGVPCLS